MHECFAALAQLRRYFFCSLGTSLGCMAFFNGLSLMDMHLAQMTQFFWRGLIGVVFMQCVFAVLFLSCYHKLVKRLHQLSSEEKIVAHGTSTAPGDGKSP